MSVKIHLMLNSKILIAGASDAIVATSLLEASNLVVLKVSCSISAIGFLTELIIFAVTEVFYYSFFLGVINDTFNC